MAPAAKTDRNRPGDCCTCIESPRSLGVDGTASLAAKFKALGDEVRLEIFRLIAAQSDPVCACDLLEFAGVSQPTLSHHLKQLRDAGLVTSRRAGIWRVYAVDAEGLAELGAASSLIAKSGSGSE